MTLRTDAAVRLRAYRGASDHEAMVAINNDARAAAGMIDRITVEQLGVDYAHLTNSDPERDIRLAELDGRVVGYGRVAWADRNSGERGFDAICQVSPAVRGRGVGSQLLAFQLGRIDAIAAEMIDLPGRAIVAGYVYANDAGGRHLLESNAFRFARRGAELVRPNLDGIPELPLPDGFEVRSIDPTDEAALRRSFDADAEAFRDHWGEVDTSDAAWRRFVESPDIRPDLWQVAFDRETGEIAGQILNFLAPDDAGRTVGWTESISVRRPYRRRGLARSLLAASLRRVRAAGADYAALGVDTENENRALQLYESLGFRVVSEQLELHRPVR